MSRAASVYMLLRRRHG